MTEITTTAAGDRPAAIRLTTRQREAIAGVLFVAPDAIGLMLFIGLPMLLALGISVFEVDGFGGFKFVGLANYLKMWGDPLFWSSLRVTGQFTLMLVPLLYVTGLGLALFGGEPDGSGLCARRRGGDLGHGSVLGPSPGLRLPSPLRGGNEGGGGAVSTEPPHHPQPLPSREGSRKPGEGPRTDQ